MDKCQCTFYQLKERGFKPINHAFTCPMFKQETGPYKEEWLREGDKLRYNKLNEKKILSMRKRIKKAIPKIL